MIELDDVGEAALVTGALFAAVIAWRWRSTLLTGVGGSWRMVRDSGQAGASRNWIMNRVNSLGEWIQGTGSLVRSSGNQSFDAYRTAALRKLDDEQREFHSFVERLHQARDQSEFDAFMAERVR